MAQWTWRTLHLFVSKTFYNARLYLTERELNKIIQINFQLFNSFIEIYKNIYVFEIRIFGMGSFVQDRNCGFE